MQYKELFQVLDEYFNSVSCYNHVSRIYETDRWFDFEHFRQTADYCAEQMRKLGLEGVELLPLKADGVTAYGEWVLPRAWDVTGAVLKVAQSSMEGSVLADYRSIPASLFMYSAPTPEGGITAEVIAVDHLKIDRPEVVNGKLIFTRGNPQRVIKLALAGGALGIVSDFLPLFPGVRDSRQEVWQAYRWVNDFMVPVNDSELFGFSLSPEKGEYLQCLIDEAEIKGKKVTLSAEVNTCFYDGICHTISGVIPGFDPEGEEVMICGHLYEPGANDNASGCGVMLALAAALLQAIREGKLSRPRRNIRFVMGFECAGLMGYYVHHTDRISRTAAAVNVDMVGSAVKDKAKMHLWHDPLSNWSQIDSLILELIKGYRDYCGEPYEYSESPFSIGDNLLADPMIAVPTVAMIMHPALSYHSSMDTMERVDPQVLKSSALIAGTFLYLMACPNKLDICGIPSETEEQVRRLMKEYIHCLESGLIENASTVPVRKIPGTLSFHLLERKIRERAKWAPFYDYEFNCPLFWADGKRNLFEIACYAAVELNKNDFMNYLKELLEYFKFLEAHGYIDFV
jgi:aminopeptidase-like protein